MMKNRLSFLIVWSVLVGGSILTPPACADVFTYSTTRRQVRAGVVITNSLPENPFPHVLYVLDSRADKPVGLEFVNPLAPAVVTAEAFDRWSKRVKSGFTDPALATGAFGVGARVTKAMGVYWEVNLDSLDINDLRQYDLLIMPLSRPNVGWTPEQREKIRRFMDGGGTFWIESGIDPHAGSSLYFARNAPFLYDVQMHFGPLSGSRPVIASPNHPLLANISPEDLPRLGERGVQGWYLYYPYQPGVPAYYDAPASPDGSTTPNPSAAGLAVWNPPAASTLAPIVWNTRGSADRTAWRPYILAGQVGAGRLIISAHGSGPALNRMGLAPGGVNDAGYGSNSGAISMDRVAFAPPVDLRFAYNATLWGAAHTTAQTNVRRTGSTPETVSAQLEEKWAWPLASLDTPVSNTYRVGGAVFYKRAVFAVDGDLILHCYDVNPADDLDNDGNPDEGRPDYLAGRPYDEIWRIDLRPFGGAATGASTPTVIEFYDNDPTRATGVADGLLNTPQRELVVVVLSDGTVVAVRAFPRDASRPGGPLAAFTRADWVLSTSNTGAIDYSIDPNSNLTIPSAAWSEGALFVALNTTAGGRLAAIDPRTGTSLFHPGIPVRLGVGGSPSESLIPDTTATPAMVSSPTVGYVRDGSGAIDKVIYVYVRNGSAGAPVPASVRSFPFGARNEPIVRGMSGQFESRATTPWFLPDASPGGNPMLMPRIFMTFEDPTTGLKGTQELIYTGEKKPGDPPPSGRNEFKVGFGGGKAQIFFGPTVKVTPAIPPTPDFPEVAPTDPRVSFRAEYVLDWAPADPGAPRVGTRSLLSVPDATNAGNLVGGAPMLAPNDLLYYTVDTTASATTGANPGRGALLAVREQGAAQSVVQWAYTLFNKFTFRVNNQDVTIWPRLRDEYRKFIPKDEKFIPDLQFSGTPVYKGDTIYAFAKGGDVSVLCAFKANPEFVLRLNQPIEPGTTVAVMQPNPYVSQAGGTIQPIALPPDQYTVDYESGLIRIHAMSAKNSTNNFVSASLPFVVQVGSGQQQLIAGTYQVRDDAGNVTDAQIVGAEGVDNLLWYMVIPPELPIGPVASMSVGPVASMSVQGDVIWLGTETGQIVSIDTAKIDERGGKPVDAQQHVRWGQRVAPPVGGRSVRVLSPPVGTPFENAASVLVVGTASGVTALEDNFTVIADSTRIIEVNAAGEAVWSADGTRNVLVTGTDGSAPGATSVQRVPFARPSMVQALPGTNDLLVVDTGNNRVLTMDRMGYIRWEINRLGDDYYRDVVLTDPKRKNSYRIGDPLTLNEPTDCTYFRPVRVPDLSILNTLRWKFSGPGWIVRYLIADSGNFRVVEVIDVFDDLGNPVRPTDATAGGPASFVMLRQINFVSSSYGEGKRYRYRTALPLFLPNRLLPAPWQHPDRGPNDPVRLVLTTISNYRLVGDVSTPLEAVNVGGERVESGGGSVALLSESGAVLSIVSNLRIPDPDLPSGFRLQPIVRPTYFTLFTELDNTGAEQFKYLLCDANGCYQLAASGDPKYLNVEWLLTAEDYYQMTGKQLQATSIRRLSASADNPDYPTLRQFLITNRYSGPQDLTLFGITYNTSGDPTLGNISGPGEFRGEVFVLKPQTFTFKDKDKGKLHGYQRDYCYRCGPMLIRNGTASIQRRIPVEILPTPGLAVGVIQRAIGSKERANFAGVLEQPTFADRR